MRMKKGIITISTIAVVILGVFFAVRFIGGREDVANVKSPDDSIVQNDKSVAKDNNETSTNENEESNVTTSEVQKDIKSTEVEVANEMDLPYITDKTDVGVYKVEKDDTVFSIAKTHMPSYDKGKIVEFIKARNNIDKAYTIKEGQQIVIPYEKSIGTSATVSSEAKPNEYTIKENDTLTSIAKSKMSTYSIKHAIEMLKEANKITDENAIKVGTVINIPK